MLVSSVAGALQELFGYLVSGDMSQHGRNPSNEQVFGRDLRAVRATSLVR